MSRSPCALCRDELTDAQWAHLAASRFCPAFVGHRVILAVDHLFDAA